MPRGRPPRRRSGDRRGVPLPRRPPAAAPPPTVGLPLLLLLLLLQLRLLLRADTSEAAAAAAASTLSSASSSSTTAQTTTTTTTKSSSSSSSSAAAAAAAADRLYPLPLPPPGLPPPIFPTFGPSRGCGPTGSRVYKAGAYCYPFHKFTIGSILASPAFRGCCRPCPEQFGLELGLLEVSDAHKARAWTRFHQWAASRMPAGTAATSRTATPAMHEAALLQTEMHMRAAKGGGGGGDAKGGAAGGGLGGAVAALGGGAGAKGGAAPGAGAAKAGDAAKGGGAAAAKGGGDAAKAGASAKAAKISPATGGGMAPDTPPPAMPPAPDPTGGYKADANAFGSPSIGFGLMMGTATHGGVTGMSTGGFVSGPQAEKLLPCCKVCPEQFLMPETLSDLSTTFVEQGEEVVATRRARGGRRGFLGAAGGGMMGGGMGGMGGMGPPPNAAGNGPTSMDTGYVRGTCCNMCDKQTTKGQRFLELLSTAKAGVARRMGRKRGGGASAAKSASSARLAANSRRRGFMGAAGSMLGNAAMSGMGSMHGATGGCCPVCPNLQTVMNAGVPPDEAFGGPFAKAQGIDLDTAAGEPLTPEEKHALKELADLAGMDHVTAARDPGMLEAARSRAQSALAGMLGGAGMMAAGAALGSLRL